MGDVMLKTPSEIWKFGQPVKQGEVVDYLNKLGVPFANEQELLATAVDPNVDFITLHSIQGVGGSYKFKRSLNAVIGTLEDKTGAHFSPTGVRDAQTHLGKEIFRVPADFSTLNEALAYLGPRSFNNVEIILEDGFEFTETVSLSYVDFSHLTISSEAEEVLVASSMKEGDRLFDVLGAAMPRLNTLINANGRISGGVNLRHGSTAFIYPGKGVKNCYGNGLLALGSTAYAQGAIFTGCAQVNTTGAGITSWGGAVFAEGADVSGSMYYGAQGAHGGYLSFKDGKANDCYRHAIRASDAGIVDADGAEAQNAGYCGFRSYEASILSAVGGNASGSLNGFMAYHGSTLNARQGIAENCGDSCIFAEGTSRVEAPNFNGSGAKIGLFASQASSINANEATITGCSEWGAGAERLSTINLAEAWMRQGQDDAPTDAAINGGSTMYVTSMTGGVGNYGTGNALATNTLSVRGVIYK